MVGLKILDLAVQEAWIIEQALKGDELVKEHPRTYYRWLGLITQIIAKNKAEAVGCSREDLEFLRLYVLPSHKCGTATGQTLLYRIYVLLQSFADDLVHFDEKPVEKEAEHASRSPNENETSNAPKAES